MEIVIFIMLLCYDNGGTCSYPNGPMSSTYSDQATCERDTEQMNKLYRVMANNSALERSRLYASCFAKTANGWASTVPDKEYQERRLAARGRDIFPGSTKEVADEPPGRFIEPEVPKSNFGDYIDQLNAHRRKAGME